MSIITNNVCRTALKPEEKDGTKVFHLPSSEDSYSLLWISLSQLVRILRTGILGFLHQSGSVMNGVMVESAPMPAHTEEID